LSASEGTSHGVDVTSFIDAFKSVISQFRTKSEACWEINNKLITIFGLNVGIPSNIVRISNTVGGIRVINTEGLEVVYFGDVLSTSNTEVYSIDSCGVISIYTESVGRTYSIGNDVSWIPDTSKSSC
jgi:hypothetical protein